MRPTKQQAVQGYLSCALILGGQTTRLQQILDVIWNCRGEWYVVMLIVQGLRVVKYTVPFGIDKALGCAAVVLDGVCLSNQVSLSAWICHVVKGGAYVCGQSCHSCRCIVEVLRVVFTAKVFICP